MADGFHDFETICFQNSVMVLRNVLLIVVFTFNLIRYRTISSLI